MIGKKVLQMVLLALCLVLLSATGAATTTILEFIEIQQQGVGGVDGLSDITSATVSPDGLNVYATGGHNSLVVFARETTTGTLSFLERPYRRSRWRGWPGSTRLGGG